jgi:AcrR family transcriptional regulator
MSANPHDLRPIADNPILKKKMAKTTTAVQKTDTRRTVATRERIVQRSILLFNRKGLRNVAIERIAADLKISPGNLTYHFPRKQQLIAATLAVMRDGLRTALERPTAVRSAPDGARYLIRLYRTLWDFRFFFNALTYVLTDPRLRREYTEFRDWAMQTIEKDIIVLCEQGYFVLPVAPNTIPLIAENMWSQWLNWLRVQQILNPLATTPADAALYDCALHHWSLCQPWIRPDYARDLLQAFRDLLPEGAIKSEGSSTRGSKSKR